MKRFEADISFKRLLAEGILLATHSLSTTECLHTMPTPADSPHSGQTSTILTSTARASAQMGSASGVFARQE
eukprot:6473575-Lingulodinium_polyedra.AAC.1